MKTTTELEMADTRTVEQCLRRGTSACLRAKRKVVIELRNNTQGLEVLPIYT